ncbi:MAG: tyrosine-type recombinase/integrase, partial [Clostridia bacterium]|nr:tyrosine-type recombinase/integrase [Clostridia bacterium]
YDNCLVRKPSGWWLRGDIVKTGLLGHEVPITDEVAAVVRAAKELAEKQSTPENNPERYLFPRLKGPRKGFPYHVRSVERALNSLARRCNIVDANGRVFHFRNHAFRHTKGIELINNGMNIVHVQKWMAHASPVMTMTYARILDTTMRTEWERAFATGAVRISATGTAQPVSLQEMLDDNAIEWEWIRHNLDAVRLPNGYCFKSQKAT